MDSTCVGISVRCGCQILRPLGFFVSERLREKKRKERPVRRIVFWRLGEKSLCVISTNVWASIQAVLSWREKLTFYMAWRIQKFSIFVGRLVNVRSGILDKIWEVCFGAVISSSLSSLVSSSCCFGSVSAFFHWMFCSSNRLRHWMYCFHCWWQGLFWLLFLGSQIYCARCTFRRYRPLLRQGGTRGNISSSRKRRGAYNWPWTTRRSPGGSRHPQNMFEICSEPLRQRTITKGRVLEFAIISCRKLNCLHVFGPSATLGHANIRLLLNHHHLLYLTSFNTMPVLWVTRSLKRFRSL